MKIWPGLILLALFSSSIIAPVFPLFDYILNYDYIVEVLCINKDKPEMECNGKCYLKDQISKSPIQTNNQSDNFLANFRFKPSPVYFESKPNLDNSIDVPVTSRKSDLHYLPHYSGVSHQPLTPPPRIF